MKGRIHQTREGTENGMQCISEPGSLGKDSRGQSCSKTELLPQSHPGSRAGEPTTPRDLSSHKLERSNWVGVWDFLLFGPGTTGVPAGRCRRNRSTTQ